MLRELYKDSIVMKLEMREVVGSDLREQLPFRLAECLLHGLRRVTNSESIYCAVSEGNSLQGIRATYCGYSKNREQKRSNFDHLKRDLTLS